MCKNLPLLALLLLLSGSLSAQFSAKKKPKTEPQADEIERSSSFLFTMEQDNAFGFLPGVSGSFPRAKKAWDFTFYGNFWTNPFFANQQTGSDFWVESGAGVAFFFKNQRWRVNPSLGFSSGRRLSGGTQGLFAEGLVPSIAVKYATRRTEATFNANYYKSVRTAGKITTDYLIWSFTAGMNMNEHLAVGLLAENFQMTRQTKGEPQNLFLWTGAYMRLIVQKKYWVGFATGINLQIRDTYGQEFYRLSAGIPLI